MGYADIRTKQLSGAKITVHTKEINRLVGLGFNKSGIHKDIRNRLDISRDDVGFTRQPDAWLFDDEINEYIWIEVVSHNDISAAKMIELYWFKDLMEGYYDSISSRCGVRFVKIDLKIKASSSFDPYECVSIEQFLPPECKQ